MKYSISWSEDSFVCSWSSHSFIKTLDMVYGVREFIIRCRKFEIRGSHFIFGDRYDYGFYYMCRCFLSDRQINKLYKYITRRSNSLPFYKGQFRELVKHTKIQEKMPRSTFDLDPSVSFNDLIKKEFEK